MTQTAEQWADLINAASSLYRSTRQPLPPGVYSFNDLPDQSPQEAAAWQAMKDLGRRIFEQGGENLMVHAYETAREKHGDRGVKHIRWAWHGIGNWLC